MISKSFIVLIPMVEIIVQDFPVVEGQRGGKGVPCKKTQGGGVIRCLRPAPALGDKHGADGMAARVPIRPGVGVKLPNQTDLQGGLLAGLPHSGVFQSFSIVHKAAWKGPARWRISPLYQHDLSVTPLNNDIYGGNRISIMESRHG
jgi:hypothetical protein